jgi:hypothetical protein
MSSDPQHCFILRTVYLTFKKFFGPKSLIQSLVFVRLLSLFERLLVSGTFCSYLVFFLLLYRCLTCWSGIVADPDVWFRIPKFFIPDPKIFHFRSYWLLYIKIRMNNVMQPFSGSLWFQEEFLLLKKWGKNKDTKIISENLNKNTPVPSGPGIRDSRRSR